MGPQVCLALSISGEQHEPWRQHPSRPPSPQPLELARQRRFQTNSVSLHSACGTGTAPSNGGKVGGSERVNRVDGESCNEPRVMGIPGVPAGVGRSRKPCDSRTPRRVGSWSGGAAVVVVSVRGMTKRRRALPLGKTGPGRCDRGRQNHGSSGEGSSWGGSCEEGPSRNDEECGRGPVACCTRV